MAYLIKKEHGNGDPAKVRAASGMREAAQEVERMGMQLMASIPPDTRIRLDFENGDVIVVAPAGSVELGSEIGLDEEEAELFDAEELVVELNDQNPPDPPEIVEMP